MNRLRFLFWGALYAAFVFAAFVLCSHVEKTGVSEFWGWDYGTFVTQIRDWRWIGYFGFRHPGLGIVMSPLVALEHLWNGAYLFVMPAVATITAAIIYQMSGRLGLVVWLSFPATWLMAGIPESFPVAQLALVVSMWQTERLSCNQIPEQPTSITTILRTLVWSALNGAITLTNGLKPVLAYLVLCRDKKMVARIFGIGFAALMLGIVFFAVRSFFTGRGIGAGLNATLSWIPDDRHILRELHGFFIRPVGLVQSIIVYPLVVLSVISQIRAGQFALVLLLVSYFSVEFLLHLVIGWGMSEPWVFAPHWIWMLPLFVGRLHRQSERIA